LAPAWLVCWQQLADNVTARSDAFGVVLLYELKAGGAGELPSDLAPRRGAAWLAVATATSERVKLCSHENGDPSLRDLNAAPAFLSTNRLAFLTRSLLGGFAEETLKLGASNAFSNYRRIHFIRGINHENHYRYHH
jgi:hypothetical protein